MPARKMLVRAAPWLRAKRETLLDVAVVGPRRSHARRRVSLTAWWTRRQEKGAGVPKEVRVGVGPEATVQHTHRQVLALKFIQKPARVRAWRKQDSIQDVLERSECRDARGHRRD
jgi:ATP-dependent DNA ligase